MKTPKVDAISLEVFKNLFEAAAEEMGVALRRASFSPRTSKNGWILAARCLTRRVGWWHRPPIFPCIWAVCPRR